MLSKTSSTPTSKPSIRLDYFRGPIEKVVRHLREGFGDPGYLVGMGFSLDGAQAKALTFKDSFPGTPGMYVRDVVTVSTKAIVDHLEEFPVMLAGACQMRRGPNLARLTGPLRARNRVMKALEQEGFFTTKKVTRKGTVEEDVSDGLIGMQGKPYVLLMPSVNVDSFVHGFYTDAEGETVHGMLPSDIQFVGRDVCVQTGINTEPLAVLANHVANKLYGGFSGGLPCKKKGLRLISTGKPTGDRLSPMVRALGTAANNTLVGLTYTTEEEKPARTPFTRVGGLVGTPLEGLRPVAISRKILIAQSPDKRLTRWMGLQHLPQEIGAFLS